MTDKELMEQFKMLVGMMENMPTKEDLREVENHIKEAEIRISIKIENEITKRLDSLTDGYKLTHEKQYELERKTTELQAQIDSMQARLYALEKKTAS